MAKRQSNQSTVVAEFTPSDKRAENYQSEDALEKKKIISSVSAFELMQPIIGELQHEEFWIIYLNNSNKVIQKNQLSKDFLKHH